MGSIVHEVHVISLDTFSVTSFLKFIVMDIVVLVSSCYIPSAVICIV